MSVKGFYQADGSIERYDYHSLDNIPSSLVHNTSKNLLNYYLKTETYTREEVQAIVSTIPKFSIQVVTTLPTTDISGTTVYLLKDSDKTSNLYTEYIYVDNKWEILGSQQVDLSGYAKTEDIPTQLSQLSEDETHRTVTDEEKETWGNKSDFSGDYNDLKNKPSKVSEFENDKEFVTDEELNSKGYAKESDLKTHKEDGVAHITNEERQAWNNKSNFSGNYNDLTNRPTIPTKTSELTNNSGFLNKMPTASEVGADAEGTAESMVSAHNTNASAHDDIRLLINGLTSRLNTLANSDDTTLDQWAEVVAYIKSNRSLIEQVTTNKVNVADIINNLTTNVSNKPLSASQGVVLKSSIDALQTLVNTLQTTVNGIKVPTKVSEFTNDSNYVTESGLTAKGYAKQSDVDNLFEEIADYKNYVTPQMFGAKADGVTDDTKAINDAIEAVGNGGTVFFPDGTYLVKENETTVNNDRYAIFVNGKEDMTLLFSSEAVVKHAPSTSAFYRTILIKESNEITVKGGTLIGDLDTHTPEYKDGYEGIVNTHGYGIRMIDSTNLVIDGVELSKYYGDPLIICSEQNPYNGCQNVVIKNCRIHDSSRNGITVTSCQGLLVKDCEIYNITGALPMAGIDIEGEYAGSVNKNITIEGCNIHDNGKLSMALAVTCEDIHIKNTVLHPRFSMSENAKNIEISGCEIYNPTVHDILIKDSTIRDLELSSGNATIIGCSFISDEESYHNVCIVDADANGRFIGCEFIAPEVQNHTFYTVRGNAQAKLVSFNGCTFRLKPIHTQPFGNIGISEFIGCTFVAELEDQTKQWIGVNGTKTIFSECVFDITKMSTYNSGYSGLIKIDTTDVVVKDCIIKALSKVSKYAFNVSSKGEVYFINNVVSVWDSLGAMPTSASKLLLSGNVISTSESEVIFTEEDKTKLDSIDEIISNSGFISEVEAKGYTDTKFADLSAQIVQQTPLFPAVNDNVKNAIEWLNANGDTTKVYVLPDGDIYGFVTTMEEGGVPQFKDWLPLAIDTDGSIFDGIGYRSGWRLNTTGAIQEDTTGCAVTGFIPCKSGDIVRISNITMNMNNNYALPYKSDFTKYGNPIYRTSFVDDGNGVYTIDTSSFVNTTAYIRISVGSFTKDSVITVNEEIVYSEPTAVQRWTNTRHSFIKILEDGIPVNVATEGDILNHNTSPDAHNDIREMLANVEVSDEQIASAIADYITKNPITGSSGRGIASIKRTSGDGTAGTTDTYTITYTDGNTSTFTVYNGTNGTNGKSAYESAKSGGYTGTESAFNTALANAGNQKTETWTFTLEDGSTVTKKVVLV